MKWIKNRILQIVLISFVLAWTGYASFGEQGNFINKTTTVMQSAIETITGTKANSANKNLETAIVSKVTDGDTIHVRLNNKDYSIRMILVDTPESVHVDQSRNTKWGKMASEFTKSQIKVGQKVYLQKDHSDTDRYGRLLRYVWLKPTDNVTNKKEIASKMYNAILLKKGYAKVLAMEPDTSYEEQFKDLMNQARIKKMGLWKINGLSL